MANDFFRVSPTADDAFIHGAARLLVAPLSITKPTEIGDVIKLATGGTQYDPQSGWVDLGATKTGIQITVNNTEETFDVDQILGDIASQPTNWDVAVATALAEVTPAHLSLAWEGDAVTTDTATTSGVDEVDTAVGAAPNYTQRRMAVLFQRPSGLIRGFFFHKVQRTPQETTIAFNKTGEQQTIPVRFKVLEDTSETNPLRRFFVVRDQTT